jgi:hypothetical protein
LVRERVVAAVLDTDVLEQAPYHPLGDFRIRRFQAASDSSPDFATVEAEGMAKDD